MFLKRYWGNRNGNAAIMFSLADAPMVVGAGMVVDYVNWRCPASAAASFCPNSPLRSSTKNHRVVAHQQSLGLPPETAAWPV